MAKKGFLLLNLAGIGYGKAKKIVEFFPDIDQILKIKHHSLSNLSFLSAKDIDRLTSLQKLELLSKELRLIEEARVEVIDIFDRNYPALLRQIASPPLVLYIKGDKRLLNSESLAVVGMRNSSEYGETVAYNFSASLAKLGLTIVSGLAKGIDTSAHKGALDAGGLTVAVLGSGLNYIYPRQNQRLADQIFAKGLVISEYPLECRPLAENFPRRNRIVSGLSKGVVVIEAAQRSGALITANFALEQNREVFAVPGRVDKTESKGPHSLIKEGAKLTESVEDILEEIGLLKVK